MSNGESWELYNIYDDIGESENLADQNPEVIAQVNDWLKNNRTPYRQ